MPASNEPFDVRADHNGARTNTYDLRQGGVVVQTKPVTDLGAVSAGQISFSYPSGLPAGSYDFQIDAVGAGGTGSTPVHNEVIDALAPDAPGAIVLVPNP